MALSLAVVTLLIGLFGTIISILFILLVERKPKGPERMVEIWRAIRIGSNAYLKRMFVTVLIIAAIIAVIIVGALSFETGITYSSRIAGSFYLGVIFSLAAAYIAMDSATRANVRAAYAARESTASALRIAVLGGAALGLAVISLSLLGLSILYIIFKDPGILAGFGFGASLAALFAQLGGGIYTKSADVGADLVGKVEQRIPEDDPRNPAVIADQVGDNVGDEAGRGADLFESVTAENVGGMIIGLIISILIFHHINENYVIAPLLVRAIGIIGALVGVFVAFKQVKFKDPMDPLRNGLLATTIVVAILMYWLTRYIFGPSGVYLYGAMLIGLVAGIAIAYITEIYTSTRYKYVKFIANSSVSGPALTVMAGISTGMLSTLLPIIVVVIAIIISYVLGSVWASLVNLDPSLGGVYGTTMATMGMLSTAGMILTMDGVGPIVDNAGGIVEMSGEPDEVRERVDPLDALGNTTKALTKGYAMASAAMAALLLFQAYLLEVARYQAHIFDLSTITLAGVKELYNRILHLASQMPLNSPAIIIGALIGGMLPFYFSGQAIKAVTEGAHLMVEEVRRQFREIPGILEGRAKPDYAKAVDIATKTSLKLMIAPGLTITLAPIIVGWLLGWAAVGALVIGATVAAVPLAIVLMWGGASLDNAKKYIEAGNLGGKGTPVHAAAVVGDTFGDPLKDTAGPSLHILVKLLNTLSLVFIPLYLVAVFTL